MKIGDILDFGIPIAAGMFLGPWGAALASGGLQTLRTGSLERGLLAGALAGGTAGIMNGLGGSAEQAAGNALTEEFGGKAAQASIGDKLASASMGDFASAAFPKGAGMLTSPGTYALAGGLGTLAEQSNRYAREDFARQMAEREQARQARLSAPGTPMAPMANYNYLDPYTYLTQGRGGVPFYANGGAVGYAGGGGVASLQQGRFVQGAGDGRSDSVPAMIDGRQPAALSSGEFVVPAHAVSAIGRGSSHAGAKKLQMMVDRVKKPKSPKLPA